MVIPMSRSDNNIAMIVMANGINWSVPFLYMLMINEGLASLYPTIKRIAASDASGILFSKVGIANAVTNSNEPCTIADNRDRAPAATLAELLTITAVTGNPPIK